MYIPTLYSKYSSMMMTCLSDFLFSTDRRIKNLIFMHVHENVFPYVLVANNQIRRMFILCFICWFATFSLYYVSCFSLAILCERRRNCIVVLILDCIICWVSQIFVSARKITELIKSHWFWTTNLNKLKIILVHLKTQNCSHKVKIFLPYYWNKKKVK